eukprot:1948217-Karenia_brevis.AAC.1
MAQRASRHQTLVALRPCPFVLLQDQGPDPSVADRNFCVLTHCDNPNIAASDADLADAKVSAVVKHIEKLGFQLSLIHI